MTDYLAELLEEEIKMKNLRRIVDQTSADLRWNRVPDSETGACIAETRDRVLELFPEGGELFNLIYPPRFERIIKERQKVDAGRNDKNIIDTDCVGL
jgi:hypothetical protein